MVLHSRFGLYTEIGMTNRDHPLTWQVDPVASETMGSQSRNISRIGEPPIQYADVKSRGLLPRVLLLRFVTFGISVGAVDVGTLSGVFF